MSKSSGNSDVHDPKRGTIYYIGAFKLPSGNAAAQKAVSNSKLFRDLGYRVVLIGIHEGGSRPVTRLGSFARDGFHSLSINVGGSRLQKLLGRISARYILRILKMRFAEPAVICYNQVALSQVQIQAYCKIKGIPFSPDATEWYGPDGTSWLGDIFKWIDSTVRIRVLNPLADAMITTSPLLTRFYARHGKPQLSLPTLFDREQTGVGAAKGTLPLRLVYAGIPFNVRKRLSKIEYMKERLDLVLDLLAEANREQERFHLDIYGLRREQYLTAFGLTQEDFNMPWVEFHGQVTHAEVLHAVKDADFTIFLRDSQRANLAGFPSKFAESITCGTPVITSLVENISEFTKNGRNCILINPQNRKESVDILRNLSLDKTLVCSCKEYCIENNPFDYRRWIDPTRLFLEAWLKT